MFCTNRGVEITMQHKVYFLVSRQKKTIYLSIDKRSKTNHLLLHPWEPLPVYFHTFRDTISYISHLPPDTLTGSQLEKQFTSKSKKFCPMCKNLIKVENIYSRQSLLQFILLPLYRFSHNAYLRHASRLLKWDISDKIFR